MPPAIAEWPVKNFAALYLALYKESTNTKLTAADSKAINNNLPIYIESYFPDTYGDTGTLQVMADLESRALADMADIKHKGTNLSLFGQRKTLLRLEKVQKYSRNGYAK